MQFALKIYQKQESLSNQNKTNINIGKGIWENYASEAKAKFIPHDLAESSLDNDTKLQLKYLKKNHFDFGDEK